MWEHRALHFAFPGSCSVDSTFVRSPYRSTDAGNSKWLPITVFVFQEFLFAKGLYAEDAIWREKNLRCGMGKHEVVL
jgi:hypothetical protein